MNLYILRHGQTDYNVKEILQGTLPIPLNETRRKQALKAKKKIDKLNIDLIISSPLKRTLEITAIINKDRNIPIITDDRLKERGFPKLENTSEKIYTEHLDLYWDIEKNYTDENEIESVKDLLKRTNSFLEDIKRQYKNKIILVVTHSATLIALAKNITIFNKKETEIPNCVLLEFSI